MPWACYLCNFLRSSACAFDRFNATTGRRPVKFWMFFGHFLTQMGPKVDFAPGAICILLYCYQRWEFDEGLCESQTVTLACVTALASRASYRR